MNIGHSSRLPYDKCAYPDRLSESVGPLGYRLNPNQIHNCEQCLSTLGPRSSLMGNGVSTAVGQQVANSQKLVDVESILSNRNLPLNKCKVGEVNPIDVNKFKLKHARICNEFLDPLSSRLTYPAATYRELGINRFYDLGQNPQNNIFWDFRTNTKLEAKDNYMTKLPKPVLDYALPIEFQGRNVLNAPTKPQCCAFCGTNKNFLQENNKCKKYT